MFAWEVCRSPMTSPFRRQVLALTSKPIGQAVHKLLPGGDTNHAVHLIILPFRHCSFAAHGLHVTGGSAETVPGGQTWKRFENHFKTKLPRIKVRLYISSSKSIFSIAANTSYARICSIRTYFYLFRCIMNRLRDEFIQSFAKAKGRKKEYWRCYLTSLPLKWN